MQRRRVVDAVANVADDVPARLQPEDHPVLLFRRHTGKDGTVLRLVSQGGIIHRVQLVAGHNAVGSEADVVGHLLRHVLVVAGHDDHRHAVLVERVEDGRNALLGRVEERREPGESHILLGRDCVRSLLLHLPECDSQDAESVGAQLFEGLRRLGSPAFIERLRSPVDDDGSADSEDALLLALGNQQVLAGATHYHGEALAVEVEGNLVYLRILPNGGMFMLQDGVVQRALDAGFKITVQVDESQHLFVVLPLNVHVPVKDDLAFGQRSGLVAAQNLDAAEILDRSELLHQNLLPGHPARALRQCDGDDHRHHLRRHPHGKRDREQERFQEGTMQHQVHQQDEKHQQHNHPGDHQPEMANPAAELGLRRPHSQPLGNGAESSVLAGAHDDRGADARLHGGSQEDAVAGVRNRMLPGG